jgi:arabinose-5-phosphate isomerase
MRNFSKKDFRRFHPGGTLGERLKVKVKEVMITGDNIPMVKKGTPMSDVLKEMDQKGIGATLVVSDDEKLQGIITDGDLRRALLSRGDVRDLRCEDVMSPDPRTINEDQLAAEALGLMELYQIMHLVIVDRIRKVKGIVHLHDLLGREEFRLNDVIKPTPRTYCGSDNSP